MRYLLVLMVSVVIPVVLGCAQKEEEATVPIKTSPAEVYITKVIGCFDHTESIMSEITKAAEAAADRAIKGGNLYVTDDETVTRTGKEEVKMMPGGGAQYPMTEDWGGFVAEACDRAGGLRHVQPVPINNEVKSDDIVLVGTNELRPDVQAAQIKKLKDQGALIIVFGSRSSKIAGMGDYLIANGLEAGEVPVMTIGTKKTGPVGVMANVINEWTFISEYVAALTRKGKMPSLYQSMFIPGAAKRNTAAGEYRFHPDMNINPVAAGVLGRQYVNTVRGYLREIKANELGLFRQAGKTCAETINSGHKVVASVIGHFMVSQFRTSSYPDIFEELPNMYGRDYLEGVLSKGDTWLHVGYSYTPERELNLAKEVGAKTICVMTPGPTDIGEGQPVSPDKSKIDTYIDVYWKHGDAVVEVPGYDTKIIPPSGVVMITAYWMIIGETLSDM
ncbi:MAG: hypothetical protein JXB48_05790 [Candidatus Latescibacteria bacterium]|nr:hypothetical protein [Candidatus Latescibacterota bacterium]